MPDAVITEGPVRIPQPGRLEPVATPRLPPLPASMLAQHAAFEALAATATLPDATREDRVRAMMANPMVRSYDLAVSLVDDIAANSPG